MSTRMLRVALGLALGFAVLMGTLVLLGGSAAARAEHTVCPAGPPACDYAVIQEAVDAAAGGDLIKVAAGLYDEINNHGGLAQVVYIDKEITLRGGYDTAFVDPPDPTANPTTLDALGQGRGLFITGDISPVVQGLRVTGGDATGLGPWVDGYAGGGVCIISATAVFSDNRVFGNTAEWGGGLFLWSSAATLRGNEVELNTAENSAGLFLNLSPATLVGNRVVSNTAGYDGGGLLMKNSGATIRDNEFSLNTALAGGGLYLDSSPASILSNTIENNATGFVGGGLFVHSSDNATISGNTISANSGEVGGGLFVEASSATLAHNLISMNTAIYNGGGLTLVDGPVTLEANRIISNTAVDCGGGLFLDNSIATIRDNEISLNTADAGGGVYLNVSPASVLSNSIENNASGYGGGGLFVHYSDNATISGNTVSANTGNLGGGLFVVSSTATLAHNLISMNTVTERGGGLILVDGPLTLEANQIISNTAEQSGGGLFMDASSATLINNVVAENQVGTHGGGLFLWLSSPRLLHTTIAGNGGGNNTGLHVAENSTAVLSNTILAGHGVGIMVDSGCSAWLEGSLWDNDVDWQGSGVDPGTVNVWGEPEFVDPAGGDYHIAPNSPALDAGVEAGVTWDMDGESRPAISGYDIGADEHPAGLWVSKAADPVKHLAGDPLTYTLRVYNYLTLSQTMVITDLLPAHVSPTGVLTWPAGPILPGGTWSETVLVTVDPGYYEELVNVVRVLTTDGYSDVFTLTTPAVIPPQADFTAVPTRGIIPLTVVFSNTSTGDFDSSWWEFGDGGGSAETNPVHTYETADSYTVTLTVSGLGGADTISRPGAIEALEWPVIFLPDVPCRYCLDFFDDFGDRYSGWYTGDQPYALFQYLNGEYRILSKDDSYIYLVWAPTCDRVDYEVELDARWAGADGFSYGILFGLQGDFEHYYAFHVSAYYQVYQLYRRYPGGWSEIVPYTYSSHINPDLASNHLKVTRNDNWITLYINGAEMGTWWDNGITGLSGVGLMSWPFLDIPTSDARFDNFRVVKLGPGRAGPGADQGQRSNSQGVAGSSGTVHVEAIPAD